MPITSVGYDGSINETQWSIMAPRLSMPYWVADTDTLAATIIKNADRTVELSPGPFGGVGVMDTLDAPERVTFEPVASGNRYDLIVATRDWQGVGGSTSLRVIKGGTKKAVPNFSRAPGTYDDHLLHLVHLQAGRTTPVAIYDLRGFGLNSRVQILDALALEGYKNWPGLQAQLGREEYTLQVDRTWVRTGLISAVSPRYRLRVARNHKMKSTNTAVTVKGGWSTAGDNTMGIVVQSNGMLKVTKAGMYAITYSISRYNSPIKVSDASVTLAIGGVWTHPMFEEHRNSNWQGVESTMFWSGILNAGDVIDPRAGQWNAKKQTLEYRVEMQIEMVG